MLYDPLPHAPKPRDMPAQIAVLDPNQNLQGIIQSRKAEGKCFLCGAPPQLQPRVPRYHCSPGYKTTTCVCCVHGCMLGSPNGHEWLTLVWPGPGGG